MVFSMVGFLFVIFSFADEFDYMFTDGYRNGSSFKNEKAFSNHNQSGYIAGAADALKATGKIKIEGSTAIVDLYTMVNTYYTQRPKESNKPIVEVMIELFGADKKCCPKCCPKKK